ncbi:hypothetical protein HDU91_000345, partial [Kappamyces sp. JEL0680]
MESTDVARKTRNTRSCDFCASRKQKCNLEDGVPCGNCKTTQRECTFERQVKKRGFESAAIDARMQSGFVQKLRSEISRLQKMVVAKEEKATRILSGSLLDGAANLSGNSIETAARTSYGALTTRSVSSKLSHDTFTSDRSLVVLHNYPIGMPTESSLMLSQSMPSPLSSVQSVSFSGSAELLGDSGQSRFNNLHISSSRPSVARDRNTPTLQLLRVRDHELRTWTTMSFYMIQILDIDGSIHNFVDAYFRFVRLHVMLQVVQYNTEDKNAATEHYRYALGCIMDDLDEANPLHIAALMHCAYLGFHLGLEVASTNHLAVAVSIANLLGLYQETINPWISAVGNVLGTPDSPIGPLFSKLLLALLHIWDFGISFHHNSSFLMATTLEISEVQSWIGRFDAAGTSHLVT